MQNSNGTSCSYELIANGMCVEAQLSEWLW
jgi:hypothetical protein